MGMGAKLGVKVSCFSRDLRIVINSNAQYNSGKGYCSWRSCVAGRVVLWFAGTGVEAIIGG